MVRILLLVSFLFTMPAWSQDQVLRPFSTDECTGYREGTRMEPKLWAHCCVEHDLFMWAGGSSEERLEADHELKACIEATGHPFSAKMMYLAVRIGSFSPIKIESKKWSNGWIQKRENKSLSPEELATIERALLEQRLEVDEKIVNDFLSKLKQRLLESVP